MSNNTLLPVFKEEVVYDGLIIKAPNFCHNRIRKGIQKCVDYHHDFKLDNFNVCPFGFDTINNRGNQYIGLITDFSPWNKIYPKIKNEEQGFQVIDRNNLIQVLNYNNLKLDVTNALNETLHDVKKLNGFVLDTCKQSMLISDDAINVSVLSIRNWSWMMKARLNLYDVVNNNFTLKQGSKIPKHIYKLFDAIKKSFESTLSGNKNIFIKSNEKLDYSFKMYDSFQLVPFVLLDNAIKYAPENTDIKICFEVKNSCIDIKISSIGPKPLVDDINDLFIRGKRSENVKNTTYKGSGLGLTIAKQISEVNNVKINLDALAIEKNDVNDNVEIDMNTLIRDYCCFIATLKIPKKDLILENNNRN